MKTIILLLAFLGMFPALSPVVALAFPYAVIDLGFLPGDSASTLIGFNVLNDSGQVVGYSDGPSRRAVLFDNGTVIDLTTALPPGEEWRGDTISINNLGQVVGRRGRVILWDSGTITTLGVSGFFSDAFDINDVGQVVGFSQTPLSERVHAVLWENGTMIELGIPVDSSSESEAQGINNSGQIVGFSSLFQRPFLLDEGILIDLGTLPTGGQTFPYGINNLGQVVGNSGNSAFLWHNGRMTDLGIPRGGGFSIAVSINDFGRVVGFGTTADSALGPEPINRALLWDAPGVCRPLNLNDLIDPTTGYTLLVARGINSRGEIAVQGLLRGTPRALLLAPTGEQLRVPVHVAIDIKPGSDPNCIKMGSRGTLPVAILSTHDFDATTVDPVTVKLAGAPVTLKRNGTPMASFKDINRDGRLDLVVHVSITDLQLTGTATQASLSGETYEGTCIKGTDSVHIVPRSHHRE